MSILILLDYHFLTSYKTVFTSLLQKLHTVLCIYQQYHEYLLLVLLQTFLHKLHLAYLWNITQSGAPMSKRICGFLILIKHCFNYLNSDILQWVNSSFPGDTGPFLVMTLNLRRRFVRGSARLGRPCSWSSCLSPCGGLGVAWLPWCLEGGGQGFSIPHTLQRESEVQEQVLLGFLQNFSSIT